jgi:ribose 5-phosphate isomerase B
MPSIVSPLRLAVGCDHAGREFKRLVVEHLEARQARVADVGVDPGVERTDYPLIANEVAKLVGRGSVDFGVLICGTGTGMCMGANRHKGVRAANCNSIDLARLSRTHNDANVLTLGERLVPRELLVPILETFLTTEFEGGRHLRRVRLLDEL